LWGVYDLYHYSTIRDSYRNCFNRELCKCNEYAN